MSKQRSNVALARGAEAIRKAEREQKLDGSRASVVKEITRLHGEILSARRNVG